MLISTLIDGRLITPPLQDEPLVPWWSFTKTVLAATALTLVRDGRLDLDASLPEGDFTLRQLLRHEAGLADYGELPEYHAAVANHESAWPVGEMMERLDGHRLRYSPGTGWHYSNVGFMLVAQIIERAADLSLADALKQQVLRPLDISTVRLATERADLNGKYLDRSLSYDPGWVYHGLLIGPVSQAAWLLDGVLAGDLLPDNLLREMQTTRVLGGPMTGRPWLAPGYALGMMRGGIEDDLMLAGHTGLGPGSVIAVYRCSVGNSAACCAVHSIRADEAGVEKLVVQEIRAVLAVTR
ncbi:D-alanyl-D-alanine carboxypeptidase precursor [compost metagenome]|uniref:Beta-lactamase n=2 Tax=Pseudomonas TaxID=286 RepID=A0AA34S0J3_PSEPU|nr:MULTISPECIES: serine hydrolase domain-containing protein [Pseudomonas]AJA16772.1 beta-lactamase [Pseudomonas putida S12]AOX11886.1 serine hydrolase [Pseudomonas putida JB]MCI1024348.1 beta-lactamase family protein [Pseudomonas putida]MDN4513028.1 serine hydrolase domain-containing protein [Pseudomonas sp. 2,4-D]PWY39647.1 serine hydrolase [Pseudomonas sp. RW405]